MIPCDLYPVLPANFDATVLFDTLPALLAHSEVTALRLPATHTLDKPQFSRLLALLHDNDVALMLDVPDGVSTLSADLLKVADGLHAPSADSLPPLRKLAGDNIQIGCLCQSRDEAMLAGERGADYIAFAVEHTDMIRWWTSVMELPAVAENVQTVEEAATATAASADFLAIPLKLDGTDETLISSLLARLQG
ncbi:thiamine phosphate synthase [Gluconobacter thailandicus]|uniref:Thiamine phosphate synthase n=1 Tax=Gluconobacter thailandicus TaxID=257438 RepID=A0AAP9EPK3_GLUTH|nr:thiamine phosphate synthase [Gluconobacter thailandicus]QEH94945.1 thiamine phosphate synthase [Gluconobacter thailandicus]